MSFADFLCHEIAISRPEKQASPHGDLKVVGYANIATIRGRIIEKSVRVLAPDLASWTLTAQYLLLFSAGDIREGDRIIATDTHGSVIAFPFRVASVLNRKNRATVFHRSAMLEAWKD
jgi:hypothetical protein